MILWRTSFLQFHFINRNSVQCLNYTTKWFLVNGITSLYWPSSENILLLNEFYCELLFITNCIENNLHRTRYVDAALSP